MKKFSISIFVLCLLLFVGYAYTFHYRMMAAGDLENPSASTTASADSGEDAARQQVSSGLVINSSSSETPTENTGYYIGVKNGFLIIYESDKSTVYEYTDILYDGLPNDLQEEISDGKYVNSLKDLYSFLENYSS